MPSHPQSPTSFQDIVAQLRQLTSERFSGSFRAEQHGVVKVLYLCDGQLACASSTAREDRLGTLLEREGLITAEELEKAQDSALPGEALGSVLLNLGTIESAALLQGARLQVESVLGSILLWKAGAFRSRPGPLPERAVNLKLEWAPVWMAAVQQFEEDETVAELLGPGDRVLCALPDAGAGNLGDSAARIMDLLDGSRDIDSVCAQADMEPMQAGRMVLAFQAMGILEDGPSVAAATFAAVDESDALPQESPESPLATEVEPDPAQATSPEEHGEGTQEALGSPPSPSDPSLTSTPVARRDLPRTLDDAEATEANPQLSFEEPGSLGHHLENEEEDPFGTDGNPMEPTPPPGQQPPRSRRGWILGAALPLVALLLVFVFSGSENPPPLNTAAGHQSLLAETPGSAAPDPLPGALLPPALEPKDDAPARVPAPLPADVAPLEPQGSSPSTSGYQAGFDAFQSGDFSKAARLWRENRQAGPAEGFTLQIMVACKEATLQSLGPRIPSTEQLFLVPVQRNHSTCYKVLWGTYTDRAQAEAAASTVPALFTTGGNRPWPVPLSSLESAGSPSR